jgi:hypothetical protein
VARLERMPREPRQELVIALAGPAVNVVLALLLWIGLAADGLAARRDDRRRRALPLARLAEQLLRVNVWLAAFNLIPAFPMDGGRVLRAVLAWRTGNYTAATVRAAQVGRFFALVFGLVGLFVINNPMLVFVALFVWLGAAGEAGAVQEQTALAGVPLERVMMTDVRTLSPQTRSRAPRSCCSPASSRTSPSSTATARWSACSPAATCSPGSRPAARWRRWAARCAVTSSSPRRPSRWRTRSRGCRGAGSARCRSCRGARSSGW